MALLNPAPQTNPASFHKTSVIFRRKLRQSLVAQMAALFCIWIAGEVISRGLGLPIPGSVVGMMFLLMALISGAVQPASIRRGARWFIAELLLFFVPAVLAVLDHPEFLGIDGLKIMAVILSGVVCVMVTTALSVDLGFRLMAKLNSDNT
ncbi:UNVERIFIED_ORG: holin-like protein [Martelella mediterranea]